MASTGLIFRTASEWNELPEDFVPPPLGGRDVVLAAIDRCMASDDADLALELHVEAPDESEDPRFITVSGVWGERERAVLGRLCSSLGARFYDPEAGDFIEL